MQRTKEKEQNVSPQYRVHTPAKQDFQNNWLSLCAFDENIPTYTSQRGEDRILHTIFRIIGATNKWCVEFGAADGMHLSNTWYFIQKEGWNSVQIEAALDINLSLRTRKRESFEGLVQRYGRNKNVTCIHAMISATGKETLDCVLSTTDVPVSMDLLCIDVDGADYDIWESCVKYKPRVVVIEHNKTVPIMVSFHSNKGSGIRALHELAQRKGYELVAANDLNAFFVTRDEFSKFHIHDNDPAVIWDGSSQYAIVARREGNNRITFYGPNKLRWVRGADGTLEGELRSGNYIRIGEEVTGVIQSARKKSRIYISGILRHIYYLLFV